jgi:hypothetical protein
MRAESLDAIGLILFGSGIALLSYVLEVFGEHTLSGRAMLGLLVSSAVLLKNSVVVGWQWIAEA